MLTDNEAKLDLVLDQSKPAPVHVPPRIDPDLYQAEIPDFVPQKIGSAEIQNAENMSLKVFSQHQKNKEQVNEFLVLVRNLVDKIQPERLSSPSEFGTSSNWNSSNSSFPLESDAAVLEYLAGFDYNVEKAWFSLCCTLGVGKDAVYTRKILNTAERTATNVVFLETKERVFTTHAQDALAASSHCSSLIGAYTHSHHSKYQDIAARFPISQGNSTVDLLGNGHKKLTAGGSHNSSTDSMEPQEVLVGLEYSGRNPVLDSPLFTDYDIETIATIGGEQVTTGRAPRNSSTDKTDLKKKWVAATKKAQSYLNRGNGTNRSARVSIQDVQTLLDEAAQLPNYTNSMSFAGGGANAQEEEDLVNSSKMVLGELLKSLLTTRDWISEVRDTLYNCNINLLIKANRDCRDITTLAELKKLLQEGENLQVRAPGEEAQLRETLASLEQIQRDIRRVAVAALTFKHAVRGVPIAPPVPSLVVANTGLATSNETDEVLYVSESDRRKFNYDSKLAEAHLYTSLEMDTLLGISSNSISTTGNNTSLTTHDSLVSGDNSSTFNIANVEKTTTLSELASLLSRIAQLPIVINETTFIKALHSTAEKFQAELVAFIAKYNFYKFTKSKTVLDKPRLNLVELLNLRDLIALTCCVELEESKEIQVIVSEALAWQREIWGLNNEVPPPFVTLYGGVTSGVSQESTAVAVTSGASSRKSKATASTPTNSNNAQTKPVPLKKVEFLLAEGEKLVFHFPTEMTILKDKKQQAKLWLEKLKKSFVPTKITSNRRTKEPEGAAGGAANGGTAGEKLKLSDMKQMVSEGEMLFTAQDVAGTGRTLNRELDKALNVVETAEDWVSRVRELLLSDYSIEPPEKISRRAKRERERREKKDKEQEEGVEGEKMEGDDKDNESNGDDKSDSEDGASSSDDEEPKPPTQKQMIVFLHNLLEEADSMPVQMEEASVLRAHLQALEWAVRVKPYLVSPAVASDNAEEDGDDADVPEVSDEVLALTTNYSRGRNSSRNAPAAAPVSRVLSRRKNQKPRLAELQTFSRDIAKIRSSLSEAVRTEFPTKPLPEEIEVAEVVGNAEKWVARVKRILSGQTNVIRKGVTLARLRTLVAEAADIPVNFDSELKPIQQAITAAEEWLTEHREILTQLGLFALSTEEEEVESEEGQETGAVVVASAKKVTSDEVSVTKAESSVAMTVEDGVAAAAADSNVTVTMEQLTQLVESAAALVADFETPRSVQRRLAEVNSWLDTVKRITSQQFGGGNAAAAAAAGATTSGSNARGGVKRAKKNSSSTNNPDDANEGEGDDNTGAINTTSIAAGGSLITIEQLETVIAQAKGFRIDVGEDIKQLNQVKDRALQWQTQTDAYLNADFHANLLSIYTQYSTFLADCLQKPQENKHNFTFLQPNLAVKSENASAIETAKSDKEFYTQFVSVIHTLQNVQSEGVAIGVELTAHRKLKLYLFVLNWIVEVRNVCYFNSCNKTTLYFHHRTMTNNKLLWGDVNIQYIVALQREINSVFELLGVDSTVASGAAPVGDLVINSALIAAQNAYNEAAAALDSAVISTEVEMTTEDVSGSGAASGSTAANNVTTPRNNRKRDRRNADIDTVEAKEMDRTSFSPSKMEVNEDEEECSASPAQQHVVEQKQTRGSQGISKKKRFDDSVVDEHKHKDKETAAIVVAVVTEPVVPAKEKRAYKKRKSEALTAVAADTTVAEGVDAADPSSSAAGEQGDSKLKELSVSGVVQRGNEYISLCKDIAATATTGNQSAVIPSSLVSFVQIWQQALRMFEGRLAEATRWNSEVKSLIVKNMNMTTGVVRHCFGAEAERLLATAVERNIQSSQRIQLEELLTSSREWLNKASTYLSLSQTALQTNGRKEFTAHYLTLEEMREFLRGSDKCILEGHTTVCAELRAIYKAGKNWKAQFDKSNYDQPTADKDVITALVNDSKLIAINLVEYCDNLAVITKTYCLCRQLYFGVMVGCDTCDEWYHFSCINLTTAQAMKCDAYVCIRCALKNSFNFSAELVGNLSNKWMNCYEHFKIRDAHLQKVAKRIARDEKELSRLTANAEAMIDNIKAKMGLSGSAVSADVVTSATSAGVTSGEQKAAASESDSSSSGESDSSSGESDDENDSAEKKKESTEVKKPAAAPVTSAVSAPAVSYDAALVGGEVNGLVAAGYFTASQFNILSESVKSSLLAAHKEVQETKVGVAKSTSEYHKVKQVMAEETTKIQYIIQWMLMLQKIVWPSTQPQFLLGFPLGTTPTGGPSAEITEATTGDATSNASVGVGIIRSGSTSLASATAAVASANAAMNAANTSNNSSVVGIPPVVAVQSPAAILARQRAQQVRCLANNLLPEGIITMAHTAIAMNIQSVEDVLLAVDAFRWMSWCNICLQILKSAPTTYELRKLLDSTKNLRLTDDKTLKLLTNILQKAITWKSKARKMLNQISKSRQVDESKLLAFILEGNSIPFSSRLKTVFNNIQSVIKPNQTGALYPEVPAIATGEEGAVQSKAVAGGKREKKPKGAAGEAAEVKGRSHAVSLAQIAPEIPDSSDDEAKYERANPSKISNVVPTSGPFYVQGCGFDCEIQADEPAVLWPVSLSFDPTPLNIEMTTSYIQTHTNSANATPVATSVASTAVASNAATHA